MRPLNVNEANPFNVNSAIRQSQQRIDVGIADFIKLTADYTLTDGSTAQKAFNATTNGALSIIAGTSYFFESVYLITNTGTTSHTCGYLFGGTATFTEAQYVIQAHTSTGNVLTAVSEIYFTGTTPSTNTVVTAASTSATENVVMIARGMLAVNAAGTLIPQVKLSAAPVGTQKTLKGSYFRIWPIGYGKVSSSGLWS